MRLISLDDYAMGRDKQFPEEWEIARPNAVLLLEKVNGFLLELHLLWPGWEFQPVVSSGFRPSKINAKVPGAAKRSLHTLGMAIDLRDADKAFKEAFQPLVYPEHSELLRKWGLFMEHGGYCPTWVHLDCSEKRADRPTRVFIP